MAVWESPVEAAGAGVAARPGHALHADAVAAQFVALRLQGAARVAVACCGDKRPWLYSEKLKSASFSHNSIYFKVKRRIKTW